MDIFGSCFLKLLLRTVFENIENIILMFFENCFCYLNLLFFSILFFSEKKNCFCYLNLLFFSILFFSEKKKRNQGHV